MALRVATHCSFKGYRAASYTNKTDKPLNTPHTFWVTCASDHLMKAIKLIQDKYMFP